MPRRRLSAEPHIPKYQQILETLSQEILSGKYKPGDRFPSEAALVQQFHTSRITVGRALRQLTDRGFVERIAGSGTFVRKRPHSNTHQLFGLLIPNLGDSEIFEPICQGMAAAPEAKGHGLLWGNTAPDESKQIQALRLCEQFEEAQVAGVFFAPVEGEPDVERTNYEVLARLERARIPIVLLDRSVALYPERTNHDLVGIDNRRAGYIATVHLLNTGAQRLAFVGRASAAPTVHARAAGFHEAMMMYGDAAEARHVHLLDRVDEAAIRMFRRERIDGYVCANDRIAGELMHSLIAEGFTIPQEAKIVGIDDVEYASLLPVPLTTVHQPCREIGRIAMLTMVERMSNPSMPGRDILLDTKLVVRASCGAQVRKTQAPQFI